MKYEKAPGVGILFCVSEESVSYILQLIRGSNLQCNVRTTYEAPEHLPCLVCAHGRFLGDEQIEAHVRSHMQALQLKKMKKR